MVRALRGRRSQVAFSRRLGFRSNVAAEWEGGRREPTLVGFLEAAQRVGVDVHGAIERFHPPAAAAFTVSTPAAWLNALRGGTSQAALAERTGLSRQQIQRFTTGAAVPRLSAALTLVDGMTGRAPDLVAALVDIEQVPALSARWRANRAAARLVFDRPWSAVVLTALETSAVRSRRRDDAWLAEHLGLTGEEVREALDALVSAGLIRRRGGGWEVVRTLTADVGVSDADRASLRAFWVRALADRVASGTGNASYNLFSVREEDLARIREVQRAAYREIRSIVAASSPPERVALVVLGLAALDGAQEG
ncbi:MAG: DUF4423 domain-containing protein [Myxococcales bacterium]|nr:DUF4423 domain-containing protein [Myxococcales bacterium]